MQKTGCWDDSESGSGNIRVDERGQDKGGEEWMKTIKIFLGRASDAWRIRITVGDQSLGPYHRTTFYHTICLVNCTTLSLYITTVPPTTTLYVSWTVPHSAYTSPPYHLLPHSMSSELTVPHLSHTPPPYHTPCPQNCTSLHVHSTIPHPNSTGLYQTQFLQSFSL